MVTIVSGGRGELDFLFVPVRAVRLLAHSLLQGNMFFWLFTVVYPIKVTPWNEI